MTVYKYLPSEEYVLSILETGYITFSLVTTFNDPFELNPNIDYIDDEKTIKKKNLQRIDQLIPHIFGPTTKKQTNRILAKASVIARKTTVKDLKFVQEGAKTLISKFIDHLRNDIGILSLTSTPDNLLMWAHYAKNHTGIIIGFDENHWYFNQQEKVHDKDFYNLRRIAYSPNRPSLTQQFKMKSLDSLMIKSPEWSYEKELRMLAPLGHYDKKFDQYHLFQIPFDAFTKVIIGSNTTDKFKGKVLTTIKNNSNLNNIKIIQTKLSTSKFKIYFEEM